MTAEDKFKPQPPLVIDKWQYAQMYHYDKRLISLNIEEDFDVSQARALRDWLNKVLP